MGKVNGISKRDFIKSLTIGAAGLTAAGLVACTQKKDTAATATVQARKISETLNADIVVVGAGASGLCATVQAAELGVKVVLLEANSAIGGNGQLTEGMFALGSSLQREQGIGLNVTLREIVAVEQEFFNYRVNALFWKDLAENSAANLDWLIKNGVKFSGVVDNYYGLGKIPVFHWFVDGKGKNFVEPLAEKAESLGVTILTKTPGDELILNEGKVVGIYAKKDDGSSIQINCKAVILASGGYANNKEMMEARGYDMKYTINQGNPFHNGDGLRMAVQAGGADVSLQRCFLRDPYFYGINFFGDMSQNLRGGPLLWVNQDAERYCNENCGGFTPGNNSNAVHTQQKSYLIFDTAIKNSINSRVANFSEDVENAVKECPGENIYKADTYEDLAAKIGLNPEKLASTINRYNLLCNTGVDEDFNKPSELLSPISTPPYYIFRQDLSFWTSIGGIHTNRNMEVINLAEQPIPGLYAVGTDGCELYRETYTMNVPASCNGNNLNSGRTAARNAVKYIS
jgi:fumarate reductase flavoprotein subunit